MTEFTTFNMGIICEDITHMAITYVGADYSFIEQVRLIRINNEKKKQK